MDGEAADEHASSSRAQREAEPVILRGVADAMGVELGPASLRCPDGARADVDGVGTGESVLVEVFAHQGRLKGGQVHKVARDALKLITLARTRPESKLVLAFGDQAAADCVLGQSWLAEALRTWGIEVLVVELEQSMRDGLHAVQVRQKMVNQPKEPRA